MDNDGKKMFDEFVSTINQNLLKVKHLTEKVTQLHNDVAVLLLETSTLYHPEILIQLGELETYAKMCEEQIVVGQEIKEKMARLTQSVQSKTTADDYKNIMISMGLYKEEEN